MNPLLLCFGLSVLSFLPHALAAYIPIAREAADGQYIRLAYVVDSVPFQNVSWDKYTIAAYAFALADPNNATNIRINGHAENGTDVGDKFLKDFVGSVKSNNKTAILSFGVYDGFFNSSSLLDNSTQAAFADSLLQVVDRYNLSGIDFAWEDLNDDDEDSDWPTCSANYNNTNSDSENFLSVLKLLRQKRTGLYLSAAVGLTPFKDSSGRGMNLVPFADVLNHTAIMAYGIFGPRSNGQVGPNAPLIYDPESTICSPLNGAASKAGIMPVEPSSMNVAVQNWQNAGMAPEKLVVGVAAFGRAYSGLHYEQPLTHKITSFRPANSTFEDFDFNATMHYPGFPQFGSFGVPQGIPRLEFRYNPPADQCGNTMSRSPLDVQNGLISFKAMVTAGYLQDNGNVPFNQNLSYIFDECSQTPYVYDFNNDVIVSYDDNVAMEAKGNFIKNQKLAGFAMWHAANDYNHTLVDAINKPLGSLTARGQTNPQRM